VLRKEGEGGGDGERQRRDVRSAAIGAGKAA